jgi:hypothetical protein
MTPAMGAGLSVWLAVLGSRGRVFFSLIVFNRLVFLLALSFFLFLPFFGQFFLAFLEFVIGFCHGVSFLAGPTGSLTTGKRILACVIVI